jgi:hypothetical protein
MRRRFQFSVEWLLALTIVVAVALVALIAQPPWISILAIRLTLIAAMGLVAVMAIQGGSLVRAFGIGAAFPAAAGAVLAVAPLFYLPDLMPEQDADGRVTSPLRDPPAGDRRLRGSFRDAHPGDGQVRRTFSDLPKADGNVIETFGELPETELRFRAGFLLGASLLSGLVGLGLAWLVLDSAEPS